MIEVLQNSGIAAAAIVALLTLVGVAWKAILWIYGVSKTAEHVLETVSKMDRLLEKELTLNGGSSMKDKVNHIDSKVRIHTEELNSQGKRISKLEAKEA